MKAKSVSMENDKLGFYINVCGKKFRMTSSIGDKDGHMKRTVFKELDEREFEERLNKIAKYLDDKAKLDTKTIIFEAIKRMDERSLKRIEKEISRKKPVRVKRGCVDLMIGKSHIYLVE